MAEVAPPEAPADPVPAKKTSKPANKPAKRKSGGGKKKKDRISWRELILKVIAENNDRKGVSLYYLKKKLAADGCDVEKNRSRIIRTINAQVASGALVQVRGTGASGSFKIGKVAEKKKKEGKKPVKPRVKKAAGTKPGSAKRSTGVKKSKPTGTPKKADKKAGRRTSGKKPTPKKQSVKNQKPTRKPTPKKAKPTTAKRSTKPAAVKPKRKPAKKPAPKKAAPKRSSAKK